MSAEETLELATGSRDAKHETDLAAQESGLNKKLSPRQVAMIGLGCTIGTRLRRARNGTTCVTEVLSRV